MFNMYDSEQHLQYTFPTFTPYDFVYAKTNACDPPMCGVGGGGGGVCAHTCGCVHRNLREHFYCSISVENKHDHCKVFAFNQSKTCINPVQ